MVTEELHAGAIYLNDAALSYGRRALLGDSMGGQDLASVLAKVLNELESLRELISRQNKEIITLKNDAKRLTQPDWPTMVPRGFEAGGLLAAETTEKP